LVEGLDEGTEYGFEITVMTLLGSISERSATTTCYTAGNRTPVDTAPVDPATLASLRRHREREEAEAWELKTKQPDSAVAAKVNSMVNTSPFAKSSQQTPPNRHSGGAAVALSSSSSSNSTTRSSAVDAATPPAAAAAPAAKTGDPGPVSTLSQDEAKREEEKRLADEWEKKKVRTLRGGVVPGLPPMPPSANATAASPARPASTHHAEPTTAPAAGGSGGGGGGGGGGGADVSGGGVAGGETAAAAAGGGDGDTVDEAEARRRAEADAAAAWEKRALTIVRSAPSKGSPSTRRKDDNARASIVRASSTDEEDVLGIEPVSWSVVGQEVAVKAQKAGAASVRSRPRVARHDPTALDLVEESEPAPSSQKMPKAARAITDEERRQAEAEATAAWENKRGVGTLKRGSDGGGGAAADPSSAVEASANGVQTSVSEDAEEEEDDAEARREAEKERMALWESRVGKGGKVRLTSVCLKQTHTHEHARDVLSENAHA
jgi:hypothetical protein